MSNLWASNVLTVSGIPLLKALTALGIGKTNQNGISFCQGKINYENLFIIEKTASKSSTSTKYFFFQLLSVKLLELTIIFNFSKIPVEDVCVCVCVWGGAYKL